ncbi:hypothetical protein ZWY2020_038473 [Hordeum vulgare]|nr:hypothetical protein ZWY2020_038473 [Hordeum vulgare]
MARNDEAGSLGKAFWELSEEMEEEPHRYEDAAEDTDPDYTTPSGVGDDTTDDGSARIDVSQSKRQWKDRHPNVLGTVKEEFTEVNSDRYPTAPKEIVKGYVVQLGCILQSIVSINTENLRHKDRGILRNLLFTKLHERYKFPNDVANTHLSRNRVNNAALTKMSTTLSTWRSAMKRMIDKGDSYEKIKVKNPSINEDDYKEFKIKCESNATAESSLWGKEMRELNLGVHQLGPGGYRVAEHIWDKEDVERAEQGLPPRFEKYGDKQTGNYVRARYKVDPVTKELTTDGKMRALELVLDTESSSVGSSQSSHWDTTLNRALNVMKNKDKSSKPSSAGRVAGKGLSMKWSSYYNAGGRKERNTNLESESREVQELKAQVARIPEMVQEQGAGADVPCTLLHFMGGELIDVAKGRFIQPSNPVFHRNQMPPTVHRVQLIRVLPGCDDLLPLFRPAWADEEDAMTLNACLSWPLLWLKSQIRLGAGNTTTQTTPPVVLAPSHGKTAATLPDMPYMHMAHDPDMHMAQDPDDDDDNCTFTKVD